jgi:predicted RNA-binding protein YlqC (UPF0109 family)
MKKIQRLTVAELKQLVKKPEAVEVKRYRSIKQSKLLTFFMLVVGCNSH